MTESKKSLGFYGGRNIGAQDARKDLLGGLHQALGPARLLRFESVHFHGQFGRAIDLGKIKKFPSAKLRAIGEVGVFGESVVLPPAGVLNSGAAPDSGRAIEIEENTAAESRRVLDGEVAVEKNRFDLGERRIIAVDVAPAGLHHGDFGIREVGNRAAQEIGRRDEVGVEDGDQLA
jgi:hypothetical protein